MTKEVNLLRIEWLNYYYYSLWAITALLVQNTNFFKVKKINSLIVFFSQNYIAACISNGFRIYDIQTGDCVMDCQGAHDSNVNHIIPLYNG